jgi:hypothetical protein
MIVPCRSWRPDNRQFFDFLQCRRNRSRNLGSSMLFREAGGTSKKGSEKMRTLLLIPALLVFALSQTALAQSTNQPDQDLQALPAKLQKTLEDAGLKDIQIVPHSFLVRAKDHDGNPVMMVVNPDSIMAVTEIPSTTGSDTSTPPRGSGK